MDDACLTYTDTNGENAYYAIGKQQLNRWQKPGDITDVPRRINNYTYARYSSDRHMHTNNYVDPEQPINGNVNFAFPAMKSVSFGLELSL